MMRTVCLIIALSVAGASAARLRATSSSLAAGAGNETSPFAALIAEFQARAQEMGSIRDPHWMRVNKRLMGFKQAVHHLALAKAEHKKKTVTAAKKTNATKKENEDPVGRIFEKVESDKTCAPSGTMGVEKG